MINDPTKAFTIPPPGIPAGVGRWVKKSIDHAPIPLLIVNMTIEMRGTKATQSARPQSPAAIIPAI
jgi:hypothetical protein